MCVSIFSDSSLFCRVAELFDYFLLDKHSSSTPYRNPFVLTVQYE